MFSQREFAHSSDNRWFDFRTTEQLHEKQQQVAQSYATAGSVFTNYSLEITTSVIGSIVQLASSRRNYKVSVVSTDRIYL